MEINIIDEQNDLKITPQSVCSVVENVLALENTSCDEVSVYFVDKTKISQLHEQFFNDPSPTDCISFPIDDDEDDDGYHILGDVFVCPHTAIKYAAEHDLDPHTEATLYVVHGLLHLLKYDDIDENDYIKMKCAEQRHMDNLKERGICLGTSHQ